MQPATTNPATQFYQQNNFLCDPQRNFFSNVDQQSVLPFGQAGRQETQQPDLTLNNYPHSHLSTNAQSCNSFKKRKFDVLNQSEQEKVQVQIKELSSKIKKTPYEKNQLLKLKNKELGSCYQALKNKQEKLVEEVEIKRRKLDDNQMEIDHLQTKQKSALNEQMVLKAFIEIQAQENFQQKKIIEQLQQQILDASLLNREICNLEMLLKKKDTQISQLKREKQKLNDNEKIQKKKIDADKMEIDKLQADLKTSRKEQMLLEEVIEMQASENKQQILKYDQLQLGAQQAFHQINGEVCVLEGNQIRLIRQKDKEIYELNREIQKLTGQMRQLESSLKLQQANELSYRKMNKTNNQQNIETKITNNI